MLYRVSMFICSFLVLLPFNVFAALQQPTIPGGADPNDPLDVMSKLILFAAALIVGMLVFGVFVGVSWGIFTKWKDANDNGRDGWGEVGASAVGGIVIILLTVAVGWLAFDYLTKSLA